MIKFLLAGLLMLGRPFDSSTLEIPEHLQQHAKILHDFCRDLTIVNEDLIKESRNGYLPNDRNLQCYLNCLFDKTGLIDKDGIIHMEHILEVLPTEVQEILEKILSQCDTIVGQDACETAWLTVKCFFEADPEHSMLF